MAQIALVDYLGLTVPDLNEQLLQQRLSDRTLDTGQRGLQALSTSVKAPCDSFYAALINLNTFRVINFNVTPSESVPEAVPSNPAHQFQPLQVKEISFII